MAKEILIYGRIDEVSSAKFINNVNFVLEADSTSEITARINTEGGSPEYGWGIVARFKEITNKKIVKNDGKSYSMGLFFNCYADHRQAVDTAQFILHRAAYSSWIESNEDYFTDAMRTNLSNINKKLRDALEATIDVEKFENLKSVKDKGITLDKVFSMDSRIDVPLTAKEAKAIGLIDEIIQITPSIKAEIEAYSVAAHSIVTKQPQINKTKNTMTLAELKAAHPELFTQVLAMGIAQERDRVEACLAYHEIDPTGVVALIASGDELTQKQMAAFNVKALNKTMDANLKVDTQVSGSVNTAAATPKVTEKEAIEAAFLADVEAGK